jgi:hypothetical protein
VDFRTGDCVAMILLGMSNYLTQTLQRRFDSADPVNRRNLVRFTTIRFGGVDY